MKLHKLTERSGQETFINIDNIVSIRSLRNKDAKTEIGFVSGGFIYINDEADALVTALNMIASNSGCACKS